MPLVCFLTAVIWLAEIADRTGLAGRIAHVLARAARGSTARLYVLVCLACALLTATLSLDGAVVVMVPVILALVTLGAPGRPLLLATIGVANAFSIALVQGNPTNLVVVTGLHLDPGTFDATMIAPGTAAALICAAVVAVRERSRLRGAVPAGAAPALARGATVAAAALVAAGIGEAAAPVDRPRTLVARLRRRRRSRGRAHVRGVRLPLPSVPWRIGAASSRCSRRRSAWPRDVAGLAAVRLPSGSVWALLAVTVVAAAVAATVNNLPAAVAAGALLHSGPAAFAVLAGVSVGALAGSRGSVATLLVRDLAGRSFSAAIGEGYLRLWPATATVAAMAATALIWFTAVRLAVLAPPHELEPRPVLVDRGHLGVDDPERQGVLAQPVLGDVAFGGRRRAAASHPQRTGREDALRERRQPVGQLGLLAEERDHDVRGLRREHVGHALGERRGRPSGRRQVERERAPRLDAELLRERGLRVAGHAGAILRRGA